MDDRSESMDDMLRDGRSPILALANDLVNDSLHVIFSEHVDIGATSRKPQDYLALRLHSAFPKDIPNCCLKFLPGSRD